MLTKEQLERTTYIPAQPGWSPSNLRAMPKSGATDIPSREDNDRGEVKLFLKVMMS